jgi:hypothetical protein
MVHSEDDGFSPHWMHETDWLVDVVLLPNDKWTEESLEYIGRLFAFAMSTDTRMLADVGDPEFPAYELWFSFNSDEQKQRFLQMVREDGYADPDEDACFDPPPSLEDLASLRPIALIFPVAQTDQIMAIAGMTLASMGIELKHVN